MSVAVAELAPNDWLVAVTEAVSVIVVPLAVPAITLYTTVNVPETPAPTLGFEQGVGGNPTQLHPAGGVIETNVVFAGVASLNEPPVAADDPVFVTTCV
jgi:hypothetical protein